MQPNGHDCPRNFEPRGKLGSPVWKVKRDCALRWLLRDAPGDRREATFPDNPAGKVWTRANITEGLEPSALPLGLSMQAAACELADRTHAGHWSPDLDAVLIPFAGDVRRE